MCGECTIHTYIEETRLTKKNSNNVFQLLTPGPGFLFTVFTLYLHVLMLIRMLVMLMVLDEGLATLIFNFSFLSLFFRRVSFSVCVCNAYYFLSLHYALCKQKVWTDRRRVGWYLGLDSI